jgi:hypothetical protein
MHTQTLSGNLKEVDQLVNQDVNWRIILKWILEEQSIRAMTKFYWFRIVSYCGLL